jgi:arylformamidase
MSDGALANVSKLTCDVHTGTHMDAPRHFVREGDTVEDVSLDATVGAAYVARVPDDCSTITAATLEALDIPAGTTRLLLRTSNSLLWEQHGSSFQTDYVALAPDAATWVVDRGIACLGVDYLSVQHYDDGPETHQILLEHAVIIIEGLNLSSVAPGTYELIFLPLKLAGSDGAPGRAILRPLS